MMEIESKGDFEFSAIETASSLSDSTLTSPAKSSSTTPTTSPGKTSSSRRKNVHQRLIVDDDMTFESGVIAGSNVANMIPIATNVPPEELLEPSPAKRRAEMDDETDSMSAEANDEIETNPNEEHMRRLAFLRVCVNYLMLNLELEPFDFTKKITLPAMVLEYKQRQAKKKKK